MRYHGPKTKLALACLLFLVAASGATPAPAAQGVEALPDTLSAPEFSVATGPSSAQEMEAFLDDFFEAKMAELLIPGAAIIVVQDGQVFLTKGYGYADVARQTPVDPAKTAFRAGSISKLFTWTAVMQLAERGLLDLDADVNRYLTDLQVPETYSQPVGPEWPTHPIPQEYLQVQSTDVETLLISGSIDVSTPPQFASEELLPYLSNGEQVILKDFGHTGSFWSSQPEARAHMLNTFFDTGQVDASLYTYQPLDFDVGLGWPGLAKLLVAVVVLVPILLLVLVWLIVRWVKRRRADQV
jgi:hypothetical protein